MSWTLLKVEDQFFREVAAALGGPWLEFIDTPGHPGIKYAHLPPLDDLTVEPLECKS